MSGFPILAWARTPVAPVGGALSALPSHALGAPVVQRLLHDTGLPARAVDAVVLGNALGAGGNPARVLALAAGLPLSCAAMSLDTQCCAGLDAVAVACGLLASGQAEVVIAGGAEAWSRAPLRAHRPSRAGDAPQPYEQPAFTPWPERDPDMLQAAADSAAQARITRSAQDAYAVASHARALAARAAMASEIVTVAGLAHDSYPRRLEASRVARMPAVVGGQTPFAISTVAISPKADGAALVLLATDAACRRWGLAAPARWQASVSVGGAPEQPMHCAVPAVQRLLARVGWDVHSLCRVELHDAFAAQGLAVAQTLGLPSTLLNAEGGGLARGHPIGASGAIALVRLLSQLRQQPGALPQRGVACVAGAGGIGAAVAVTTPPQSLPS